MHVHFYHDREGRQLWVKEGYSSGRIHLTLAQEAVPVSCVRFSGTGWEQWRRGLAAALAGGPSLWSVRNQDDFETNWVPDEIVDSVYADREVLLTVDAKQPLVLARAEAAALLSYGEVGPIVPALPTPMACTPLAEQLAARR